MRNLCKFVGVTYGEFQSWYNYGELRICSSRFVDLETTPDGTPDSESPHVSTLLERIPQLNLEDEEGILLIQLKPVDIKIDNYQIPNIDFHTMYLPIECIQRVIPLTERAGRILEPRMGSFRVIISPSYFDKQVRGTWFRLGLRKALRGGDSLVKGIFRDGLKIIGETLRKAVEFGICELDYHDCSMEDLAGKNLTWIAEAFKYSRREPFKAGDLDYIMDAGVLLKKSIGEKNSQLLQPLRDVVDEASEKKDKIGSIEGFFNHSQWNQSISKMEESKLLGTTSAGFTSLVLFLRWKEQFHKMNQKVDFSQLYEDAAKFAVSIDFEQTVSAVWIFGCFVGYENVTQEVYTDEKYSFSSLTEPLFKEKISKPEKEKTDEKSVDSPEKEKADAEVSEDSTSKIDNEKEAEVKGKKESTNKKATDDVKEEESIQKAEKLVPEEAELKKQEDKTSSEPKTTGESEEGVTDESAAPDKKSDKATKEKEKAELKTHDDQTASEPKTDSVEAETSEEGNDLQK